MHIEFIRDKAKAFAIVESPERVTSLRVWHCKYATLSAVANLHELETLVIATFPDMSLNILGALPKLRYLRILHLPRITTLEPLKRLERLETLSLETLPSWDSRKRQIVDSLAPLTQLPRLKHLQLIGVVPADRALLALYDCKTLESARLSRFPAGEVERFRRVTGVSDEYNPSAPFESLDSR
jgi:hypothetical protein